MTPLAQPARCASSPPFRSNVSTTRAHSRYRLRLGQPGEMTHLLRAAWVPLPIVRAGACDLLNAQRIGANAARWPWGLLKRTPTWGGGADADAHQFFRRSKGHRRRCSSYCSAVGAERRDRRRFISRKLLRDFGPSWTPSDPFLRNCRIWLWTVPRARRPYTARHARAYIAAKSFPVIIMRTSTGSRRADVRTGPLATTRGARAKPKEN